MIPLRSGWFFLFGIGLFVLGAVLLNAGTIAPMFAEMFPGILFLGFAVTGMGVYFLVNRRKGEPDGSGNDFQPVYFGIATLAFFWGIFGVVTATLFTVPYVPIPSVINQGIGWVFICVGILGMIVGIVLPRNTRLA